MGKAKPRRAKAEKVAKKEDTPARPDEGEASENNKKATKKEKKNEKKKELLKKVEDATISKASKKRRRKEKNEAVLRSVAALESALPAVGEEEEEIAVSSRSLKGKRKKIRTTYKQRVITTEQKQFESVLEQPSFQEDPAAAIHAHLLSTVMRSPEEVAAEAEARALRKGKKGEEKARERLRARQAAIDDDEVMIETNDKGEIVNTVMKAPKKKGDKKKKR
mmetsp:Transcript_35743/g.93165  ORF Transcript_35743/g.93165 Transcript_35743/m.93165 type:complete len:221 (-) Transcript_35743:237-899(-)